MATRPYLSFALLCALAVLAACSGGTGSEQASSDKEAAADPLAALGIKTSVAEEAEGLPLGTVPGTVSLPPEAKVAVTSPFPGAAVKVFVIEGQNVRRGQALALVRAAEPVQIRGDLARAQAETGYAEAQAKRLRQLADEGIIAKARAEEAQAQLSQARASLSESRRMASLAGAGADGTMTLTAPISGRVAHVAIDTGGPVDGMTAPFVIENSSAYRIDLQLPERMARSVAQGMAVSVRLPGEGGEPATAEGMIISVAPSIDPLTRSVMAKASIGSAQGLVAGQNLQVTIRGNMAQKGVAVPSSAVTRIEGADHVFVREGKGYKPRKVTLVAEADGKAFLSGGLKSGETVATSSIAELKSMAAE